MVDVDPMALYRRGTEEFGRFVVRVGEGDWTAATPCTDWTVRDLVRHVVEEDLWAAELFAGLGLEEAGSRLPADPLGDDPASAYASAAAAALVVADADGAAQRLVHLSFGDLPGAEYAMQLFADHLIHSWDLATALGVDATLAPDLVRACREWFTDHEAGYRASGAVGPRPDLPDGADELTRLLAAFGRTR